MLSRWLRTRQWLASYPPFRPIADTPYVTESLNLGFGPRWGSPSRIVSIGGIVEGVWEPHQTWTHFEHQDSSVGRFGLESL